tara:strand:+ start:394 stop:666 length:273 start_codon:yes stop_codon:yes gene_type:complete
MKYSEFILGSYILVPKEGEGYINFISKDYITICLHEIPHNKEYAEHSVLPYRQVLILVYRANWHELSIIEGRENRFEKVTFKHVDREFHR